ncbi:hypothetical protein IFR05_016563, partial [Cadophora sp. M221]
MASRLCFSLLKIFRSKSPIPPPERRELELPAQSPTQSSPESPPQYPTEDPAEDPPSHDSLADDPPPQYTPLLVNEIVESPEEATTATPSTSSVSPLGNKPSTRTSISQLALSSHESQPVLSSNSPEYKCHVSSRGGRGGVRTTHLEAIEQEIRGWRADYLERDRREEAVRSARARVAAMRSGAGGWDDVKRSRMEATEVMEQMFRERREETERQEESLRI